MKNETRQERKSIKIQTLNICIIITACILCALIYYTTNTVESRYAAVTEYTQEHVEMERKASMIQSASDYLTNQVRLYVQNMDLQYAYHYFEEVNVSQRRETALASLDQSHSDESLSASLEAAVKSSNDLMQREIYAMKLVSEANGYDDSSLPPEVVQMQLTEADMALSPEGMMEKANALVFNADYEAAKAEIMGHLSTFTDGIRTEIEQQHQNGLTDFHHALTMERILIAFMILILFLIFAGILMFVIKPLRMWQKNIENHAMLEPMGPYEFRHLASVYNNIYRQNETRAANEMLLKQKLDHDPLTGIWNRNVFQKLDTLLADTPGPLALMLIDVDHFKEINDTYGHETGDRILQKIARYLEGSLRVNDYIFRIGGDEFAGIILDLKKAHAHVIKDKIARINESLQNPEDGLPAVSLSVGVAFSSDGYHDKLYVQADKALYDVKEQGRCGCAVF